MKKTLLILALALLSSTARAGWIDSNLGPVWDKLSASKNFHALDNATPASFYNFRDKNWYGGVSTSLYRYKRVSLDIGTIKPLDRSNKMLPIGGANIHFNNRSSQDFAFLGNLTVGVWYCREWTLGLNDYGVYGGYSALLGGTSK